MTLCFLPEFQLQLDYETYIVCQLLTYFYPSQMGWEMEWWVVFDEWNLLHCWTERITFVTHTAWTGSKQWCSFSWDEILQQVKMLFIPEFQLQLDYEIYIVSQLLKSFYHSQMGSDMEWSVALDILSRFILIVVSIVQLVINFKHYQLNKTKINERKASDSERELWYKFSCLVLF